MCWPPPTDYHCHVYEHIRVVRRFPCYAVYEAAVLAGNGNNDDKERKQNGVHNGWSCARPVWMHYANPTDKSKQKEYNMLMLKLIYNFIFTLPCRSNYYYHLHADDIHAPAFLLSHCTSNRIRENRNSDLIDDWSDARRVPDDYHTVNGIFCMHMCSQRDLHYFRKMTSQITEA